MMRGLVAACVAASLAVLATTASAGVPATVGFTARIVDDESGDPINGARRFRFELFEAATGGTARWSEARSFELVDGMLFADLGETTALDASVFDGRRLWLEVTVDDKIMEPRVALASVPYAVRAAAASEAEKVGGKSVDDLQARVTGTCGAGNFVIGVNANGTVACAPDLAGSGDITEVAAGTGLQGGGPAGAVTLSMLTTCAAGQLLKWSGAAWACANDIDTDTNGGGDITDVIAGAGLVGGGAAGAVTVDVGAGTGISVAANTVSLDTAYTDARYVNATGDTLSGPLDMGNQRLTNRACPSAYTRVGPGLCAETNDTNNGGFSFTGCANRCRAAGTHLCSSAEMRAVMQSGVSLGSTTVSDWIDDQDADDSAFYVNSASADNLDGVRTTVSPGYCRCCANVE